MVVVQSQIFIVSHPCELPGHTGKCVPQRISSEPLFGDQDVWGSRWSCKWWEQPREGQLLPFLPTDGQSLAPTNQASCMKLSQAVAAQQRPPGDGAPSGERVRTSSWGNQPPRFLHLVPCIKVIENRLVPPSFAS